jgi:hypothetical protein
MVETQLLLVLLGRRGASGQRPELQASACSIDMSRRSHLLSGKAKKFARTVNWIECCQTRTSGSCAEEPGTHGRSVEHNRNQDVDNSYRSMLRHIPGDVQDSLGTWAVAR